MSCTLRSRFGSHIDNLFVEMTGLLQLTATSGQHITAPQGLDYKKLHPSHSPSRLAASRGPNDGSSTIKAVPTQVSALHEAMPALSSCQVEPLNQHGLPMILFQSYICHPRCAVNEPPLHVTCVTPTVSDLQVPVCGQTAPDKAKLQRFADKCTREVCYQKAAVM